MNGLPCHFCHFVSMPLYCNSKQMVCMLALALISWCRTILDAVMMLCHIFSFALGLNDPENSTPKLDDSNCKWVGVVYQFAVSGSTAWYLAMSFDLFLIIRNPFRYWCTHTFETFFIQILHTLSSSALICRKEFWMAPESHNQYSIYDQHHLQPGLYMLCLYRLLSFFVLVSRYFHYHSCSLSPEQQVSSTVGHQSEL